MMVRNWEKFQHYKDRNPPWVKLHKQLLDNPEWFALPDAASRLLVEVWLLASENDGNIPDVDVIAFRVRRPVAGVSKALKVLMDKGFVVHASTTLYGCLPVAVPETETETETETDKRLLVGAVREVFEYWVVRRKVALNLNGGPPPVLSAKRSAKIVARMDEGYDVPALKEAVDGCMGSDFHREGGHTDIELICRDQTKVESFLHRKRTGKSNQRQERGNIQGWSPE